MKKSYIKILIFNIILITIFLIDNFTLKILNNINKAILLFILLILFKILFGIEKDRNRYTKDIIINILIIMLAFFLIFYLFGLVIGFVRTSNYYNFYGMSNFIIPYIFTIILKEKLRYQIITKSQKSNLLIVISTIMFILFDLTGEITFNFSSRYYAFLFISMTILPIIGNNIVCTYISKNTGYKPNIIWMIIINLYGSLLPIVPNINLYMNSLIKSLLPFIILFSVYNFFEKRKNYIPVRINKKTYYIFNTITVFIIILIVYFYSGYFKYYVLTIATGSMIPNIEKGDIVILNQKYKNSDLKVGRIIAYRYKSKIIVHRLVDIEQIGNSHYYYTKGDANNAKDNYIIYPEMIIGVVEYKVPYLGLPSVWLNEL